MAKKKGFSKEVKASVLNKVFSPGKVEKKKSDKKAGSKPTIAAALRAFATAAVALAEALEEQPLVNASTVPVPAPEEPKGKKKKTKVSGLKIHLVFRELATLSPHQKYR